MVAPIASLQDALRNCSIELHRNVTSTHLENATLVLSQMSVEYQAYDAAHIQQGADLFLAWATHTGQPPNATRAWAEQQATAQAQYESDGIRSLLQSALDECQSIRSGARGRPATQARPLADAPWSLDSSGYFTANGEVYLPFGLNERPDSSPTNQSAVPPSLFDETLLDLPLDLGLDGLHPDRANAHHTPERATGRSAAT